MLEMRLLCFLFVFIRCSVIIFLVFRFALLPAVPPAPLPGVEAEGVGGGGAPRAAVEVARAGAAEVSGKVFIFLKKTY